MRLRSLPRRCWSSVCATYWDTYFAGRAAPLGRDVPAGVVHAIFYNFAPDEAARHIPRVWDLITPEAALAARDRGYVAALRRMLGDPADNPSVARAADLAGPGPIAERDMTPKATCR